jgi:hypothetical protein
MGRDGRGTHDDVSVYGRGGRGEHCCGPAGHGGRKKRERRRGCVMSSLLIRSGSVQGRAT